MNTYMNKTEYVIRYAKAADKFFKLHEDIRTSYEDAIEECLKGDHPETVDIKRIQGKHKNYYRMRLGGYRIIYMIMNDTIIVVNTLLAGSRGDVYKKMSGMK